MEDGASCGSEFEQEVERRSSLKNIDTWSIPSEDCPDAAKLSNSELIQKYCCCIIFFWDNILFSQRSNRRFNDLYQRAYANEPTLEKRLWHLAVAFSCSFMGIPGACLLFLKKQWLSGIVLFLQGVFSWLGDSACPGRLWASFADIFWQYFLVGYLGIVSVIIKGLYIGPLLCIAMYILGFVLILNPSRNRTDIPEDPWEEFKMRATSHLWWHLDVVSFLTLAGYFIAYEVKFISR